MRVFDFAQEDRRDGTVKLLDTDTKEVIRTLPGHTNSVVSVAFIPTGNGSPRPAAMAR
jgi:WD40 repeat protein